MKILIVTPAAPGSLQGNRTTADRWARLLRELGHRVQVDQQYTGQACDLLLALHARKSHDALRLHRRLHPDSPRVLALTGTDIYRDIHRGRKTRISLEWADRLVVLQPLALAELPRRLRPEARVIYQTAPRGRFSVRKAANTFDVCIAGHLRAVKDPFRAALAARLLRPTSRLRVLQAGAALSRGMARRARAEVARNPRYRWLGPLSRWRLRRLMARSHVLVLSSKLEGGANVVSEAVAVGLPVVASRVPGNVGLLGKDYPGYFPCGDTRALASLLDRVERDPALLRRLRARCARLAPILTNPRRERAAWHELLAELEAHK